MAEAVRALRADEADARAVATLFAWTLGAGGGAGAWNALLGFDRYRDLAQTFAREMAATGDAHAATRAAFAQW